MEKENFKIFDTPKRIRLGIWGLGRGMSFFRTCSLLNIDVVAGCDYNKHMRDAFLTANPGAAVTADADEFLRMDFDAVLLATFCPAHADDAIRCLKAGKHVLSEVTAFHTMAEGVRLVEEVERSGLVYNLAENYPFTARNMWLANRWREGLFGELMYAEFEYVHECRSLCYVYNDPEKTPVQPGHTVHSWRSWQNYHYYCTHSLGPVMVITGTRPTRVVALPGKQSLAGYLEEKGAGMGTVAPSLINMSNGSVIRNLMGATTNDNHCGARIWGSLGAAETEGEALKLRLGGSGSSPKFKVNPTWEGKPGKFAQKTGHGGGDFWVLYYFAREILTGEKGPFDIYGAADVTIPGILALRSSLEGGRPYDVPDFRKKEERDKSRNDNWAQKRYDVKRGVFGGAALNSKAERFTSVMKSLVECALAYRAYADWKKMESSMADPAELLPLAQNLKDSYEELRKSYKEAREIIEAYPGTDGARVLSEMLETGEEGKALTPSFLPTLEKDLKALKARHPACVFDFEASELVKGKGSIAKTAYPSGKLKFSPVRHLQDANFFDLRPFHGCKLDGLLYARCAVKFKKEAYGKLDFAADGPVKVFINGEEAACDPKATNPIHANWKSCPVKWRKGKNEIMLAIRTNRGKAWGFAMKTAN